MSMTCNPTMCNVSALARAPGLFMLRAWGLVKCDRYFGKRLQKLINQLNWNKAGIHGRRGWHYSNFVPLFRPTDSAEICNMINILKKGKQQLGTKKDVENMAKTKSRDGLNNWTLKARASRTMKVIHMQCIHAHAPGSVFGPNVPEKPFFGNVWDHLIVINLQNLK